MSMLAALSRHLQRLWWTPRLTPLTALLAPLGWLVGVEASRRRDAYASGRRRAQALPVPVIVVGNVIVGGAGKTPTVIALVALLRDAGWRPGIVSRGHGRADAAPLLLDAAAPAAQRDPRAFGDEPLLMHRRTGAPVVVARRRRDAAQRLLDAHPDVDIVIADDGLQHHALPRDIELVVFDSRGLGNGWPLPAGPLRERVRDLWPAANADLGANVNVNLTSAPAVRTSSRGTLSRPDIGSGRASASNPNVAVARFVLVNGRWPAPPARPLPALADGRFEALRTLGGAVELAGWQRGEPANAAALDALRGRPLLAAAGIGDPERFFSMLEARGLRIERRPLPDHATFMPLPWPDGTPEVIVTEKDAVKLAGRPPGATRVWVVTLDFALPDALAAALSKALAALPRPARAAAQAPSPILSTTATATERPRP